jgi:PPK2 family polyphosphate:nucleotide phosphotransferase
MHQKCRVEPGSKAELAKRASGDRLGCSKKDADDQMVRYIERTALLHNRLYAEAKRSILLVLQGLDASGKDGTIKRVFTGLNPQSCEVHSFKAPTPIELAHDFLWRIHLALPERGDIGIFNRSHYEDVVTTEVLGLIKPEERKRRYAQINEFERMLTEEGTTILKVFLHIGKDEQRARLQSRLDNPEKSWKFRPDDLDTRAKWDDYLDLYDKAITATSTKWAPWYIVPADHKYVSGLAVASLLVETLETMDPKIPPPMPGLDGIVVE